MYHGAAFHTALPNRADKAGRTGANFTGGLVCRQRRKPSVVATIFTPKDFLFGAYDGSCMAANMSLAAWSLGLGSCFIGSAWEAFACELGQKLLRDWNIPGNYHADIQLCLGYPLDKTPPQAKPRKDGRIIVSE
jgi:nitroreductase